MTEYTTNNEKQYLIKIKLRANKYDTEVSAQN